MEQLRDTYASDSLVKLAKDLGFNGEPAHIDQANGREQYTLSLIHKWLILEHRCFVEIRDVVGNLWTFNIKGASFNVATNKNYTSYDDALEIGLHHACIELKEEAEYAYKVLE